MSKANILGSYYGHLDEIIRAFVSKLNVFEDLLRSLGGLTQKCEGTNCGC